MTFAARRWPSRSSSPAVPFPTIAQGCRRISLKRPKNSARCRALPPTGTSSRFPSTPPSTLRINELARLSGVEVKGEAGLFNHNFRTLIIDAGGRLQATFPFGGDLSDAIVAEMLKAAAATNPAAAAAKAGATPGIVSIPAKDANTR